MMLLVLHSTGIAKEEVTEDVLPKGIPPFPGKEYTSCCGHVSLGICELRIVPCESAKVVYKSNLCTLASSRVKLNKPPVYMYGLFMTLALTFFLCTEVEELLTLRQRVESLERDVGGLEAIVLNLDHKRRRQSRRYGGLLKLDEQLEALYDDANNGRPFVSPDGQDEDELVSTCIYYTFLGCCCVLRNLIEFNVCIASQSFVGDQNCGKGVTGLQYCYDSIEAFGYLS